MAVILSGALGVRGDLVQDGQVEKAWRVASHTLGALGARGRDARLRLRSRLGARRAVLRSKLLGSSMTIGDRRAEALCGHYHWPF